MLFTNTDLFPASISTQANYPKTVSRFCHITSWASTEPSKRWRESHSELSERTAEQIFLCLQEYQTIESPRYLSQKDVEKALKDYPYHNIQIVGRGSGKGHTNRIACYSKFPILSSVHWTMPVNTTVQWFMN